MNEQLRLILSNLAASGRSVTFSGAALAPPDIQAAGRVVHRLRQQAADVDAVGRRQLEALPQPVVGKIRGACAGFGFSLMAGCDLALAADNAYFTTGYSLLGTTADGGGTYFLPRLVGAKKAAELTLLAERLDAQQALALGLVNRVVPAAELDAACEALAIRLAAGPSLAYANAKRLLNRSLNATLADQLAAEAASFAGCSASDDFAEGVMAFVEKRKPAFRGR